MVPQAQEALVRLGALVREAEEEAGVLAGEGQEGVVADGVFADQGLEGVAPRGRLLPQLLVCVGFGVGWLLETWIIS